MMPTIPLRHRLPNPPAHFVGRSNEIQWLDHALKEAPVSIVWGGDGLGKSALVSHVICSRHEAMLSRVLFISAARTDEPRADLLRRLLHVTLEALGYEAPKGRRATTPLEQISDLIDLADSASLWIVLDDLSLTDSEAVEPLLDSLSRYARRSRWIITSRCASRLTSASLAQLQLGLMSHAELSQLASMMLPDTPPLVASRLSSLAGGSPWRLRQAARFGEDALSEDPCSLTATERDALKTLSALSFPASITVLRALGITEAAQEGLVSRSLVVRSLEGFKLHDIARKTLPLDADADALARQRLRVLDVLVEQREPNACLNVLRLALSNGRPEVARSLLDREGEALIRAGFAPEIWAALAVVTHPTLESWRLRAAWVFGSDEAIQTAQQLEPSPDDLDARLAHLHLVYLQERFAELEPLATTLAEHADQAKAAYIAADARLLAAITRWARNNLDGAQVMLDAITTTDPEQTWMKKTLQALLLLRRDDLDGAKKISDQLRDDLKNQSGQKRVKLAFNISLIDYNSQAFDRATRLFMSEFDNDALAFTLFSGRRALVMGAVLSFKNANLAYAAKVLQRFMTTDDRRSPLSRRAHLVQLALDQAFGRLDHATLALTVERCVATEQWEDALFGAALMEREAVCRGPRDAPPTIDLRACPARSPAWYILALSVARRTARHGGAAPSPDVPEAMLEMRELRVYELLTRATRALLDREPAAALLKVAAQTSNQHGLKLLEVEVLQLRCLDACLHDPDGLSASIDALRAVTAPLDVAPIQAQLDWWSAIARRDLSALFYLTQREHSGGVRRWACAILSNDLADEAPHTLDLLEAHMIKQLRARWGLKARTLGVSPCAHLLDLDARALSRAGGDRVELSTHRTPWRLLTTLITHGGEADKEQLVDAIWSPDEYHPLKHDNRLRLTARNLRRLIEAQPTSPRVILTSDEGYKIGESIKIIDVEP